MFVLPDVVSASIVCVVFMEGVFSLALVCTKLTEILNTILSYKSYFAFFMTLNSYFITHNTLPFFYHMYYIYAVYSYICIYFSML